MEKNGGDEGGRTPYLNAASVALYQLSYAPNQGKRQEKQKSISGFFKPIKFMYFGVACHRKVQ